jgi:hypothetical protein
VNITKQSAPRIATWLWVIGVILSGFVLSVAPGNLPIYIGLTCLGVVPLIFGSSGYKIFGVVAVCVSLALAYWEIDAGLRIHARRLERMKMELKQTNQDTNVLVPISQKP